jgi:CubicO group peptidase (beta-lactamase class C family)
MTIAPKHLTLTALVVVCLTGSSVAQDVGTARDGHLRALLDSLRTSYALPALAAVSIHGDSVLEMAATGVRAVGFPERVRTTDRWHLGSLTKAMTATLAAMLVERGSLSWTTTVQDVFPQIVDSIRPEFTDVRLDELLSHTSGISGQDFRTPSWLYLRSDTLSLSRQRRRWAVEFLQLPPSVARGTYGYANGNYVVAGAMMETVTGRGWEDLMRDELYPLVGMIESGFGPPGSGETRVAPWGHRRAGQELRPVAPGPFADNPAAMGPAGTVHSTLSDYAGFLIEHLAGANGIDGIVSARSFRKLHAAVSGNHALGWIVVDREWARGPALTHSGSNTMWFATTWMAPGRNLALFAVTNAGTNDAAVAVDRAIGVLLGRILAIGDLEPRN